MVPIAHSRRVRPCTSRVLLVTFTALVVLTLLSAAGADNQAPKTEQPPAKEVRPETSPPSPKATPKKLTGAELYSIHCNRCHPERYPTERTAAQWKTILLHMRVRANLPGDQARTILKYLQDNSGR
jgi:hypothetical protein